MNKGLVSVTFRHLDIKEIISITKKSGLFGIEWGSDIHVPVGNIKMAEEVAKLMEDNGLVTISYGSYYKAGEESNDFAKTLDTAVTLKTKNIRVWAGTQDSEKVDNNYWEKVVTDLKRISDMALEKSITISLEYHGGTLTNTQKSTVELLKSVNSNNLFTYWQPLANTCFEENINNISELKKLGWLKNIHCYHWVDGVRLPFSQGEKEWKAYFEIAKKNAESILMEFVKDDSVDQFYDDIKILDKILL